MTKFHARKKKMNKKNVLKPIREKATTKKKLDRRSNHEPGRTEQRYLLKKRMCFSGQTPRKGLRMSVLKCHTILWKKCYTKTQTIRKAKKK